MTDVVIPLNVGDAVEFVDAVGQAHSALITAIWGSFGTAADGYMPSMNIVYVSNDEKEHDQYGNQIKRHTSVVHEKHQAAYGMFWRYIKD